MSCSFIWDVNVMGKQNLRRRLSALLSAVRGMCEAKEEEDFLRDGMLSDSLFRLLGPWSTNI